jgi:alkylmercury lyase
MPLQVPAVDAHERVREVAFALILTESRPVAADELAVASGGADIATILDELAASGRIDRGDDGRVTGSAGLSLSDGPHHLTIGTRPFRTWCAYDALGIPAALAASARVETTCGECGTAIVIPIIDGKPQRSGPERLWLAAGGDDLRTSFCTPTVLLCGLEHGAAWAEKNNGDGELLGLDEASERGAADWASAAETALRFGAAVEFVGGPRNAQRDRLIDTPVQLKSPNGGHYQRSVRCADDGALRYVWQESAPAVEPVPSSEPSAR